ncbi:MAG: DUF4332 domain-containing protein [Deltaproteobacteria bacterium]|nr:DUF4332 domain-containing protein [Deltaproteobacteria bacterium]
MAKLTTIEGIGDTYAKKLRDAGVTSTDVLLERGAKPGGRKDIEEKSGISAKRILRWVNHCDLSRIKGVSGEYAELLEAGGVDTVPELSQRNAENLHQKLEAVNREKKLVRKLPTQSQIGDWIAQAKQLPRIVSY